MSVWQRFKDWWLGGDPADVNWLQGYRVVGSGPFPLFHERRRMQEARGHARVLLSVAAGVSGPVVSSEDQAVSAGLVLPGWLARELPAGSLVAREGDPYAASCGRFRLYNGTWSPPIEGDHERYIILYLSESVTPVR